MAVNNFAVGDKNYDLSNESELSAAENALKDIYNSEISNLATNIAGVDESTYSSNISVTDVNIDQNGNVTLNFECPDAGAYHKIYSIQYNPKYMGEDTSVIAYLPGDRSDGSLSCIDVASQYALEHYNQEGNVSVIYNYAYANDSSNESIFKVLQAVENINNTNVADFTPSGFSAGAKGALQMAIDYATNVDNPKNPTVVLMESAFNGDKLMEIDSNLISDFGKVGGTIIAHEATDVDSVDKFKEHMQVFAKQGVDVFVITGSDGQKYLDHTGTTETAIKAGALNQKGDSKDCSKFDMKHFELIYNNESGKWEYDWVSYSNEQADKIINMPCKEMVKSLESQLAGNSGSDYVSTNYQGISNGIEKIRQSITSSSFQEQKYTGANEKTTYPQNVVSTQNSLYGISSQLMSDLSQETKAIVSVLSFYNVQDNVLSNEASKLDGGKYSSIYRAVSDAYSSTTGILTSIDFAKVPASPVTISTGHAGIVNLADVKSTVKNAKSNLDLEVSDANKVKDAISSFIADNVNAQGSAWDSIKTYLDSYNGYSDLRIKAANVLSEAYSQTEKIIEDYMNSNPALTEVDDSELPELYKEKEKALDTIEKCKADIAAQDKIINDPPTTTVTVWNVFRWVVQSIVNWSAVNRAKRLKNEAQKLLDETQIKLNEEIIPLINKLELLSVKINECNEIINEAMTQVYSMYGAVVGNITASNEIDYGSSVGATGKMETSGGSVQTGELDSKVGSGNPYSGGGSYSNTSTGGVASGGTDSDYEKEKSRQDAERKKTEEAEKKKLEEEQKLKEEAEKRKLEEEQKLKEEAEKRKLEEEQKLKEEAEKKKLEEEQKLKDEEEIKQLEEERRKIEEERAKLEKEKNNISSSSRNISESKPKYVDVRKNNETKPTNLVNDNVVTTDTIDSTINEPILPLDNNIVEPLVPIEPVVEPIEDEIAVEPIPLDINPVDEPTIIEPQVENTNKNTSTNNVGKTIGIVTGAGIAIGAAAVGANAYMKSKQEKDDSDYE